MGIFDDIQRLTDDLSDMLDDRAEIKDGDSVEVRQHKSEDSEIVFIKCEEELELAKVRYEASRERMLRNRRLFLIAKRDAAKVPLPPDPTDGV